jgi:hypothetical protein
VIQLSIALAPSSSQEAASRRISKSTNDFSSTLLTQYAALKRHTIVGSIASAQMEKHGVGAV